MRYLDDERSATIIIELYPPETDDSGLVDASSSSIESVGHSLEIVISVSDAVRISPCQHSLQQS